MLLRDLFRPWLRVARPDDWTGKLAQVGLWPIYLLVLLVVGIVRIPVEWWLLGFEVLTRLLLLVIALYLFGWIRMIVWSLLPGAAIQFGRNLWFRYRGRRIRLETSALTTVNVEQRPPPIGEVFIIEVGDGAVYDLCPVRWDGAQRIYRVLARRVRRSEARDARRLARARRKAKRARAKSEPAGHAALGTKPAASPAGDGDDA